ncbi:MAG: NAD(P)H-hydrate dehydratase [Rhizobacter sp.]
MRRAGAAIASLARALHPHARRAWIACGTGNNGGDGLDAAIRLLAAGLDVEVTLVGDANRLPRDAADALLRARAAGVRIASGSGPNAPPDVGIDALLGLGRTRAPDGRLAESIAHLNALPCPVLAIDVPSGLNADTGQAHGDICVTADHTLTLLTLKPGLFTGAGRDRAGEVWFDDLGMKSSPAQDHDAWLTGAAALHTQRDHAHHKGSFGDVAVVGGAHGMVGAALLAARAAHAAGAGRVCVDVLDDQPYTFDSARPELMLRHGWWRSVAIDAAAKITAVAGCGGGTDIAEALPRLLSTAGRLVLDADALNALANDIALVTLLAARRQRQRETVLTPHPLEAARLLRTTTANVQSDRVASARELAQRLGGVVVLKGSGSIVASPEGAVWINGTGSAALASAGTGDVLAGWIAGAWSASGASALAATRHATWLHGLAAERSQTMPLRAADLIDAMHQIDVH